MKIAVYLPHPQYVNIEDVVRDLSFSDQQQREFWVTSPGFMISPSLLWQISEVLLGHNQSCHH